MWAVALGKAQSNKMTNSSPPQRPSVSHRALNLALPPNAAAKASEAIARSNALRFFELGLIANYLCAKLFDCRLAFSGHSFDLRLQLRSALFNRRAHLGQVVQARDLLQPCRHGVHLSRTALISLSNRFGSVRHDNQQFFHLASPLLILSSSAHAPVL